MTNITRRGFLKGSTIAAGALALHSFTPVVAATDQRGRGVLTAGRMGPIRCDITDGKLVATTNDLAQTVPNALQQTGPDQVHTKARVKYPMVRKGFLENPSAPRGYRGKDEFVRVSWDEAYKLIHEQHMRIRTTYGPSSIFAGSIGWRSSGVLHAAQPLLQRYMSMAGGYTGHLGDFSTGASQVIMPHVIGSIEVYEQQTTFPIVLEHTDVIVLWGLNPLNSLRVAWTSNDCSGLEFFHQLKKSGKKIIAIDPMRSETIQFLDTGANLQWIAPHPMTDVAMMLGIAHSLATRGKHDKAFLDKYTEGYAKFEAYLLGQTDGIPKSPQWAEKICGVPAKQLEVLADIFSQNRTMLMSGWSIQRQQFGEQRHWMLVTLASMLGQIGLPGGGFGLSYHYSNGGNPKRDGGVLPAISASIDSKFLGGGDWDIHGAVANFPVARIVDVLENPGKTIKNNGSDITYPNIKMVWWAGGANFSHQQDINRLSRAWQRPELVVISEIYWTAAARHADVVLPITTSFERNDLTMTGDYSNQHLVPMKQVVEPQGEARNDFDVFADMAELLKPGGRAVFTENKSEMQWLYQFYTAAQAGGRAARVAMPNFSKFWQDNQLIEMKWNQKNAEYVRYAEFRADPVLNPLGTPSGKIEIYSKVIEGYGYPDCPPHPTWLEPVEYTGNAKNGELQLMTAHPADRLHSQFNYAKLRETYAIANREPIFINTEDAKARGISTGDLVRAYNQRGQILVGANVTDGIKQGSVCVHEGAWFNPDPKTGICKNGACNVLTLDIPCSQLSNACSANSSLVKIEKYTGPDLPMTAFDPPPNAD